MENNDWLIAILDDIEALTSEKGLPAISASVRRTRRIAMAELAIQQARFTGGSKGTGQSKPLAREKMN